MIADKEYYKSPPGVPGRGTNGFGLYGAPKLPDVRVAKPNAIPPQQPHSLDH